MKNEHLDRKDHINFCQRPSKDYMDLLDKCGNDPRIVAGRRVIMRAGYYAQKSWHPDYDARDARR